ncbi:MAG: hypothetical protein ABL867_11705, partial [Rickettsiales bacterium]
MTVKTQRVNDPQTGQLEGIIVTWGETIGKRYHLIEDAAIRLTGAGIGIAIALWLMSFIQENHYNFGYYCFAVSLIASLSLLCMGFIYYGLLQPTIRQRSLAIRVDNYIYAARGLPFDRIIEKKVIIILIVFHFILPLV